MSEATRVVPVENLEDWFRQSLAGALASQQVVVAESTEHYVVQLLTGFSRSERLYEHRAEGGRRLKPLAITLADAFETRSPEERRRLLQRLGDVALFIAGFFAEYVHTSAVDRGYYSRMGETAYGMLSELPAPNLRAAALAGVFTELAHKFTGFVDALGEIAQQACPADGRDLLRFYEEWLRTGSPRAATKLRALGVEPSAAARTRFAH